MSLVTLDGAGLWMPSFPGYLMFIPVNTSTDAPQVDADEEEIQIIGAITLDGGGSKTFGTSSKIGWHVGSGPSFAAGASLRVGVKQASKIDLTVGPPARATIGRAAFDVWDDLVGGTDTLAVAWRDETMTAGTPFTLTDGDYLVVCFHLDIASGTALIRMRNSSSDAGAGNASSLMTTLVSAGPTYANTNVIPNVILACDDGTLAWFEPTKVFSAIDTATAAIGQGNSLANIVQVPFPCQIDALGAYVGTTANTGDCALELVGTPLGTPMALETLSIDANRLAITSAKHVILRLPTPRALAANTPYAISLKQLTATATTCMAWDVPTATYFKPVGMGANCYGALSTAGATFVAQNSGRRRYHLWMRISALDDGAGGAPGGSGGGSVFGAVGGVIS